MDGHVATESHHICSDCEQGWPRSPPDSEVLASEYTASL